MTSDLLDLAAAVVQASPWRWLPGMVDTDGWRCVDVSGECATMVGPLTWGDSERPAVCHVFWRGTEAHGGDVGAWRPRTMLPDFDDPATRGCLLALVREAWGDPGARTTPLMSPGRWRVVVHELAGHPTHRWFDEGSEPAALVAALLAAPPK